MPRPPADKTNPIPPDAYAVVNAVQMFAKEKPSRPVHHIYKVRGSRSRSFACTRIGQVAPRCRMRAYPSSLDDALSPT